VHTRAHGLKIVALVLLGLGVAFYLTFAIGEMAGGDVSGIQHLPPAVILAVLLLLSWRHPLAAGIVLLVLAVPLAVVFAVLLVVRDLPLTWAMWIALPPTLTGLLLVWAGQREHTSH
jgi:hypothetical protein